MDVERFQNDSKEKVMSSLHKPYKQFRKGRDEFIELCITLVYQQHAHGKKKPQRYAKISNHIISACVNIGFT